MDTLRRLYTIVVQNICKAREKLPKKSPTVSASHCETTNEPMPNGSSTSTTNRDRMNLPCIACPENTESTRVFTTKVMFGRH